MGDGRVPERAVALSLAASGEPAGDVVGDDGDAFGCDDQILRELELAGSPRVQLNYASYPSGEDYKRPAGDLVNGHVPNRDCCSCDATRAGEPRVLQAPNVGLQPGALGGSWHWWHSKRA